MVKITYYKDSCGTYSITENADGSATLRCRNASNNNLDVNRDFQTVRGARISLSRYCDGMPQIVGQK